MLKLIAGIAAVMLASFSCANAQIAGGGGGGGAPALMQMRQAWIGDSRQASFSAVEGNGESRIQMRNYGAWAEALTGCRLVFDWRYVWGYSGQTAEYELTQYPTTVAANYSHFDVLFIESPANDIKGTSNLFTSAIPAVQSMEAQALAHGKRVVLMGFQPFGTAGWTVFGLSGAGITHAQLQIAQYNRWAAQQAQTVPGVTFVNVFQSLADSTGTGIASNYIDGLHVNNAGAFVVGQAIAKALSPLLSASAMVPQATSVEGYDARLGQMLTNPVLTGTGGSKNTGSTQVSGSVPTGWDISRVVGTANGLVVTQTAQTTGFGAATSSMTLTNTFPSSASTGEGVSITTVVATPTRIGAQMQGQIMVDISGTAPTNLVLLEATLNFWGATNQAWTEFEDGGSDPPYPFPTNTTMCLKTPVATVPAGVTSSTFVVFFQFNPSLGNASATLTFHDPVVNYVN